MAPEVLSDSYTYKCDIWSIEVIAYILLCGFPPFSGGSDIETLHLVETAKVEYPSPEWDTISNEAKDFVQHLLQRDAYQRPTAANAMEHPWIAIHVVPPGLPKPRPFREQSFMTSTELRMDSERRSAFQKFLAKIKVTKTLYVWVAEVLTPVEARGLGKIFQRFTF